MWIQVKVDFSLNLIVTVTILGARPGNEQGSLRSQYEETFCCVGLTVTIKNKLSCFHSTDQVFAKKVISVPHWEDGNTSPRSVIGKIYKLYRMVGIILMNWSLRKFWKWHCCLTKSLQFTYNIRCASCTWQLFAPFVSHIGYFMLYCQVALVDLFSTLWYYDTWLVVW